MKHEKRKARIQILPPFLFWSRTTLRCACAPLFARSWPAFAFIVICELTASAAPIFEQKNSKEKKGTTHSCTAPRQPIWRERKFLAESLNWSLSWLGLLLLSWKEEDCDSLAS